jgi:hypothetical protein
MVHTVELCGENPPVHTIAVRLYFPTFLFVLVLHVLGTALSTVRLTGSRLILTYSKFGYDMIVPGRLIHSHES